MPALSEEQVLLRDAARAWAGRQSPTTALRRVRDGAAPLGYEPAAWDQMAAMGWAGVIVPEAYGGSDFGCRSMGLLLEETGRTLTASPLLATGLVAASALVLGGTDVQRREWLPKIAAGELVATLAVDEGAHHAPERTALGAVASASGYTLTGAKAFVLEGMAAGLFVVAARTSGRPGERSGITLFLVPGGVEGVGRTPRALADSRGYAAVAFDRVELGAEYVLGPLDEGWDLLERVLDRARAGVAAEMLGAAGQAFEITLEYLKTRVQFGQPIGAFQALQHRAAKMFTELELARSAVEAALDALDEAAPDAPLLVSLAKAKTGDAIHLVSNEMVQLHGGIGMTDVHDAGLYLKRARALEAIFGGQAFHRDRYARLQGY
ncbi:acyl-CoA dehydrogenase family protein [Phenylobacterium sp.]|uniref:acyl-CoA dehydrogenase family protein n=1 Tax=Phenylobacterium sp. TaxID=1871053 RepID=UPI002F428408